MKRLTLIALLSTFVFAESTTEISREVNESVIKAEEINTTIKSIVFYTCVRFCPIQYTLHLTYDKKEISISIPSKFHTTCLRKITMNKDNKWIPDTIYEFTAIKYMTDDYQIKYYINDDFYKNLMMKICW